MIKAGFQHHVDKGRLIVTPLFTGLLIINLKRLAGDMAGPINPLVLASLINQGLIVFFYLLVIYLYFIRTAAMSTTDSRTAKAAAVTASFLPFLLPLLRGQEQDLRMLLAGSIITIAGMVITLYSLKVLGKSFSIIPQARSLVQTGPYRFVRHPLYAGELISMFGIVLAGNSVSAWAVFCSIAMLQLYRAMEEEKVLMSVFPNYVSSFTKKARFIPGIF